MYSMVLCPMQYEVVGGQKGPCPIEWDLGQFQGMMQVKREKRKPLCNLFIYSAVNVIQLSQHNFCFQTIHLKCSERIKQFPVKIEW